ncbi:response regulator [Neobacillus mesonae]|nr:response regulator [Neobacillus mesonae]
MYKLMIVDDELLMRVGIRSMLDWEKHEFYVVGEASNGKEALELALEVSPDVIITDIKMPIMDGLQLIQHASDSLKTCKYVILSNFDEFQYVKTALKLGAVDYLIKTEITEALLVELLTSIRMKLQKEHGSLKEMPINPHDITQSLSHLKNNFFQDIVSGFIDRTNITSKAKELHIRIREDKLVLIKFKVNYYESVKKKYIEKGEKLLRFSIQNILDEIIPSKWKKEIVVESSSEYWVIVNMLSNQDSPHTDIKKLCDKILFSIKDFMNLTLSAGISTVVTGFSGIRRAYQEAELALRHDFFEGNYQVLFYDDVLKASVRKEVDILLDPQQEQDFLKIWLSKDEKKAEEFLEGIRSDLEILQADENSIRKNYISVMELINNHLSRTTQRVQSTFKEKTLYETVLKGEYWEDIHEALLTHIVDCFKADSRQNQERSYADLAIEIIDKYYAEDISLHRVANQINVNPSYLSRMFKQEKGENFISYLTKVRIESAKAYLMNRELRVYEIADKVGYQNYTYFNKIFKKMVGLTPEEYRELQ